MDEPERQAVQRWSAALREIEVLEPWLTESHLDEGYWDDVAALVVTDLGPSPSRRAARPALERALRTTFPDAELHSDRGLYRDHLRQRLDLIVDQALPAARRGRLQRWRRPLPRRRHGAP